MTKPRISYTSSAVRVFAPATVANVAVGYDILGFAIEQPGDEIIARQGSEPGLRITKLGGSGKGKVPREVEKNTAGMAALKLLQHLNLTEEPIELEIFKNMPFASGIGGSAASAAAGVMAVNELLGKPLTREELTPFAMQGEAVASGSLHGDNVIPSLLGGIVLIRDNKTPSYIKLPSPLGLYVFVIKPDIEIKTKDARNLLSAEVSLENHIKQSGNLGTFVASLYLSNFDLMRECLEDLIIEPQRAKLIPHFYEMQKAALANGAINYTISGAGPAMFGFADSIGKAEEAASAVIEVLTNNSIESQQFISTINTKGTYKM